MSASEQAQRQRLAELLAERSYRRGVFRLASGRESDFYVDVKKTVLTADGAALIGDLACVQLARHAIESVGGMAVGAVPLVAAALCQAAARQMPLSGFFVRKQVKDHGTAAVIDGPFDAGRKIALLEDVVTTGESTMRAVEAVEREGGRVALVITVVDREEDDGMAKLSARLGGGTTVCALAARCDILRAARP